MDDERGARRDDGGRAGRFGRWVQDEAEARREDRAGHERAALPTEAERTRPSEEGATGTSGAERPVGTDGETDGLRRAVGILEGVRLDDDRLAVLAALARTWRECREAPAAEGALPDVPTGDYDPRRL